MEWPRDSVITHLVNVLRRSLGIPVKVSIALPSGCHRKQPLAFPVNYWNPIRDEYSNIGIGEVGLICREYVV